MKTEALEHKIVLHVTMLGQFSISYTEQGVTKTLTDQKSASKRLWSFLEYLIYYHDTSVEQEKIIDMIWPDEEVDDPVNSLKTLLHRARRSLESIGIPNAKQVLLYKNASYSWGDQVEFVLDTEQFDQLYKEAQAASDPLDGYLSAIQLYTGQFLPRASYDTWVLSLRTYYHTLYLKICIEAAALLEEEGRQLEIIDLCKNALNFEQFDEDIHLLLMQALTATGAHQAAIQHYNHMSKLFMEQLGVMPSERITDYYRVVRQNTNNIELNLHIVQDHLLELSAPNGPYFCEYAVFQDVYRLEARLTERTGQVIQLALLSILPLTEKGLTQKQISLIMSYLKETIDSTLRRGDAYTRFSPTQYLVLLPCASYENGNKVLLRLIAKFKRSYPNIQAQIQSSVLPLIPGGQKDSMPQTANQ